MNKGRRSAPCSRKCGALSPAAVRRPASFSPRTFSNMCSRSGTSMRARSSPLTSSTTWPWCSITVRSPTSSACAHAVGDHHGGELGLGDDARRQLQHEVGRARVERGGVLVQQQDARRLQRRHQQAHGLALAAREQADAVGQAVFQAQAQDGQALAEVVAHLGLDGAAQAAEGAAALGQGHVFLDGQVLAGARHGVLEDAGHALGAGPHGQARHVLAGDLDAALVHGQVARDGVQEGGLAGAVRADDGDELAVGNVQRHAAQRPRFDGRAGVEGDFELLCAQHECNLRYFFVQSLKAWCLN